MSAHMSKQSTHTAASSPFVSSGRESASVSATCSFLYDEVEVSEHDLALLHEVLPVCDAQRLLFAIANEEVGWNIPVESLECRARSALVEKIASSLQVMASLSPHVGDRAGEIIVPWERFEVSTSHHFIRRRVGACLVDPSSASSFALRAQDAYCCRSEAQLYRNVAQYPFVAKGHALSWGSFETSMFPLACQSWPDALGKRIWLPSCLTEKERYRVLGAVYWAMTYWGFDGARNKAIEEASRGMARIRQRALEESYLEPFVSVDHPLCEDNASFELMLRMENITQVLNYCSWADLMRATACIARLDQAA